MNAAQYHKATLNAIDKSEKKIDAKITKLEIKLNHQTDYIDNLEYKISSLKHQVTKLNSLTYLGNSSQKIDISNKSDSSSTASLKNHEIILGAVEEVTLDAINDTLDARVDTGAKTSSINAEDIERFERNSEKWVRFHIANNKSKKTWIEAPIIRNVKIRQATRNKTERRIVIKLWVTVGDIHEKTEFTLANRTKMSHPILLGREFIRDIALVDVSRKYIHTKKSEKITNDTTQTQTQTQTQ